MDSLIFFAIILAVFYAIDYTIKAAHNEDIRERQQYYKEKVSISNLKKPQEHLPVKESFFCYGSIVIGVNYWQLFVAGIKQVIGGHLRGFEKIMERAFCEATLRMVEQAYKKGAQTVINVRMETACIGKTDRKGKSAAGMLEVLVYGTALKLS